MLCMLKVSANIIKDVEFLHNIFISHCTILSSVSLNEVYHVTSSSITGLDRNFLHGIIVGGYRLLTKKDGSS